MYFKANRGTLNMNRKIISNSLEIFLMNDQPFTCPNCGSRCFELADFLHTKANLLINECLNKDCSFICGEEEDQEYLKLW